MNEMGLRCGIRKETDYRKYNSYKGFVGETFENVIGRDFEADGPWQKMGTDVTEFKALLRCYLAPVYDWQQGDRGALDLGEPRPRPAGGRCSRSSWRLSPMAPRPIPLRHGLAVPARVVRLGARGERVHPEHVAQGQLHRQRRHRAGLRPHEGRVLQGRDRDDFEAFKADLEAYIEHWNTRRRQVRRRA